MKSQHLNDFFARALNVLNWPSYLIGQKIKHALAPGKYGASMTNTHLQSINHRFRCVVALWLITQPNGLRVSYGYDFLAEWYRSG